MKKKILIGSIIAVVLLTLVSFSSVVGKVSLEPVPDLDCDGEIALDEVKPGSTIITACQVYNVGEPNSLLNWEVSEFPNWGEWYFTPDSYTGLESGDSMDIIIELIAPNEPECEFEGEIELINSDNVSDFCTIPVYLTINNPDLFSDVNYDGYTPIQLVFQLISKLRNHKDIENVETEDDLLQIIEEDKELNGIFEKLKSYDCGCEDDYKPELEERRWWIVCMFLAPIWLISAIITIGTGQPFLENIVYPITEIFNCGF